MTKKAEDPDHQEFTIYLPEGHRVPGVSDSIANAQGLTYGKCSISNVFVERKEIWKNKWEPKHTQIKLSQIRCHKLFAITGMEGIPEFRPPRVGTRVR